MTPQTTSWSAANGAVFAETHFGEGSKLPVHASDLLRAPLRDSASQRKGYRQGAAKPSRP